MAAPDESDNSLSDHAPDDEYALCQAVRLPPGDRSLAGTTQEGGDFIFAELAGVDLTAADFYWALFHNATLEKAVMARCDLRGAVFNEANLRHADLSGANCGLDNLGGSTDFIEADLSGADLRNANLGGANFTGARLIGADLSGVRAVSALPDSPTRFQRANLAEARLRGAQLTGALYDHSTVFPRGFKPDDAGMVVSGRKSPADKPHK